jgi:hypothetical protein
VEVNEHVMARPAPALRPFVAYYSGYRQRGLPPGTHRGLPSPWLTLIVTIGEPLVVAAHPDRRQAPGRYDALLGGLHVSPALITHDGFQSGVQVAVSPLGCRAFFGMPAAELANLDTDLAGVITGPVVDQVREQVITAATWPERFAAIDDTLLRLAARHDDRVPPEVARAFRRLVATGGDLPIWPARSAGARATSPPGSGPSWACGPRKQRGWSGSSGFGGGSPRAYAWPSWPPTPATSIRPTWPATSTTSPDARRRSGWPTRSVLSKPAT